MENFPSSFQVGLYVSPSTSPIQPPAEMDSQTPRPSNYMDSQTHPLLSDSKREILVQNPKGHIKQKTSKKAMEKFQEFILKLAETHPNSPLTPAAKTHVQNQLNQLFSLYKTPDHPPYSAMIERALCELNEKGGSSEESISQFLKKEYTDLPLAHSTLLKHHLGKLCESGDIVTAPGKRYMIVGINPSVDSSSRSKRKPPLKRKSKWRWAGGMKTNGLHQNQVTKKGHQRKGDEIEATEKHEKPVEEDQAKRLLSCDDGEHGVCSSPRYFPSEPPGSTAAEEVRTRQEICPSEIMKAYFGGALKQKRPGGERAEDKCLELASPEKPPGFESVRVEHLSHFGVDMTKDCCLQEQGIVVEEEELLDLPSRSLNREAKPILLIPEGPTDREMAFAEELSQSKRVQRQLRRWSRRLPEPNAVTMTSAELGTCSEFKDQHSQELKLSSVVSPEDQENTPELTPLTEHQKRQEDKQYDVLRKNVASETKQQGIRIYCRRGKAKSQQPQGVAMKLEQLAGIPSVNLLEPNAPIDTSNPSRTLLQQELQKLNEEEPQRLLQPPHQGEISKGKQPGENVTDELPMELNQLNEQERKGGKPTCRTRRSRPSKLEVTNDETYADSMRTEHRPEAHQPTKYRLRSRTFN